MWWKRVVFRKHFIVSLALAVLVLFVIIAAKGFLPPVVPLFYGRPFGAEQLASYWYLFLIPAAMVVVSLLNLGLNLVVKDAFIKKTFAAGALVFSVMATITVLKIIFLVGFF